MIDLHSHTINGKSYDNKDIATNYTHEKFYNFVKSQAVSLKAVTNHNTFVLVDHIKQAIICELLNVNYIPGVEYDLKFKGNRFHAIVLLSPKTNFFKYEKKLKEKLDKKSKKRIYILN